MSQLKGQILSGGKTELLKKFLVEKSNLGFGMRSWRYAMVVNDCKIEKMFVEPGFSDNYGDDPFEVSDADTVLAFLKGQEAPKEKPARLEFVG